jgi:hypothetical protein
MILFVAIAPPYPDTKIEVRKRLGLDNEPMIVFIGSFVPCQDIIVLIRAFAVVHKEWPGAYSRWRRATSEHGSICGGFGYL